MRHSSLLSILYINSQSGSIYTSVSSSRLYSIGIERKIIVPDKIQPDFGFRQGQRAQLDAIAADQLESFQFFQGIVEFKIKRTIPVMFKPFFNPVIDFVLDLRSLSR